MKKIENHWLKTTGYSGCIFFKEDWSYTVKKRLQNYLFTFHWYWRYIFDLQKNCHLGRWTSWSFRIPYNLRYFMFLWSFRFKDGAQMWNSAVREMGGEDLGQGGGLENQGLQLPWISHLGPRGLRGILMHSTPSQQSLEASPTHRKKPHRLLKWGKISPPSAAEHPGPLHCQPRWALWQAA